MKFGKRIKKLRTNMGYEAGAFAINIGISRTTLRSLEADRPRYPGHRIMYSLETLHRISKALKMPLSEIFNGVTE